MCETLALDSLPQPLMTAEKPASQSNNYWSASCTSQNTETEIQMFWQPTAAFISKSFSVMLLKRPNYCFSALAIVQQIDSYGWVHRATQVSIVI